MQHRHLNHQRLTLAAIDDVIARGHWRDWTELRRALLEDRTVLEKVQRICRARIADSYAQRTSGCTMPKNTLPDWELVLSSVVNPRYNSCKCNWPTLSHSI